MEIQSVAITKQAIDFIERNLDQKLDLDGIAAAVHYSKYHLHRIFGDTVGMTIHDYARRRQLTEAAKLLAFSDRPILDVAMVCGYESQQAFTATFKAMYKQTPARYRQTRGFYPLQLRFTLQEGADGAGIKKSDIVFAGKQDIPAWMELTRLVIDGYPCMDEEEYLQKLKRYVDQRRALMVKHGYGAVGVMAFSHDTGGIEFFGIHPQYRRTNLAKVFLNKLAEDILPEREIVITTYREGDRADTGHRDIIKGLGFGERELLTEFGYPAQRFVFSPVRKSTGEVKTDES